MVVVQVGNRACSRPRLSQSLNTRMDRKPPLVIHEVLPTEILMTIFEEHAKLEWSAPAIDGRVCRLWREIVLNTPRAWSYLEFGARIPPTVSHLQSWLNRSCTAPLHIRFGGSFSPDCHKPLVSVLCDCHTRIVSLRMRLGNPFFFERRDFPCLLLLDIKYWLKRDSFSPPFRWGTMPMLRSLSSCDMDYVAELLDSLAPLKKLILYGNSDIRLPRHSMSLVVLMLHGVSFDGTISGSVDFPSLTYLSLNNVSGLKPHINAPCLVTYHESLCTVRESFLAPVPSLVEYGVYGLEPSYSDPIVWHRAFPNILRLSIRSGPHLIISLFDTLSGQPHSLPSLQMIGAGPARIWYTWFSEGQQETMRSLIRARNEVCHLDVALYFEMRQPFHIPLFFSDVRRFLSNTLRHSDMHTRTQNVLCERPYSSKSI